MRASQTLPPLQALRAFEAVARLLSFRRAGEELLITQSAVSHHIGALERHLGARLFIRKARGVILTPEGERLSGAVREAFALIAAATADLSGKPAKRRVRVSLLPSFAANWLAPRLINFTATHPEIELALDPTLRMADLEADDADIAIRFGDGRWEGAENHLLMAEWVSPVASPALLSQGPPLREPKDILAYPLIMSLKTSDWDVWADANGVDLRGARTLQLLDYNISLQAAVDGAGVAIGRMLLIGDRLRSGALIQPFAEVSTSGRIGYWLHRRPPALETPEATAFAAWILREAADL